jgi:hypothetical protein
LDHYVRYFSRHTGTDIPDALVTAHLGLHATERAVAALGLTDDTALDEAINAGVALARARTVAWPPGGDVESAGEPRDKAASIADLVMVVSRTLLTTANKVTDPADRIACFQAVQHAGRLQTILRRRQ